MDYLHSFTSNICESKPIKVNGKETKEKAKYYPGFEFTIKAVRDPMNKMVKSFFPCFLLGLFHLCSFQMDTAMMNDRLACISIVLLTNV